MSIAEKYFREAATRHVHCRTLIAVAERFLEVGCSLISSLVIPIKYLAQPVKKAILLQLLVRIFEMFNRRVTLERKITVYFTE